ncbi:MAG TPA: uracil-DNA glycosylase [Syntrophobacteraceae bacterium]|nr:uracil-DNA glycosylase [Syntrophobacteraceae bacterium]HBZ54232.1 uracil-DNA glycosylase [Syntrophobacteraceae bacterium]
MSGLRYWPRAPEPAATNPQLPATGFDTADSAGTLQGIRDELGDCQRCRLHESRTTLVFGDGSPAARLVFVGEAPGYDEDQQGLPFVGRAGRLLDRMILAMGMKRSEVYICNVVKCRPPQNRNPSADEVVACSPFLFRQIEAIQPQVICLLGNYATQTLLQTTSNISQLRGKDRFWRGIPVVATFHPAYLLRNPAQKASTWSDLRRVLELVNKASDNMQS